MSRRIFDECKQAMVVRGNKDTYILIERDKHHSD